MLMTCPECNDKISDKAVYCPHCGFPVNTNIKLQKPSVKNNKRMKLPNGFGQISEIKNRNLRKRFRAMITVGKTDEGKPIVKPLKPVTYFSTYNEAYAALVKYKENPYDLNKFMTVKEVYDKWSPKYYETIVLSSKRGMESAWRYSESIHNMNIQDLRARHIRACIKAENVPTSTRTRIKVLYNLLMDYAVEYELIDRNYSRELNIKTSKPAKSEKPHIAFTDDEMDKLWNSYETIQYVGIVLIQCYMGWRPQELGNIEMSNINLNNWTVIGGMKTENGIDRIVPVHSKIRDLFMYYYNEALSLNSKYLFNHTLKGKKTNGLKLTYDRYSHRFDKIVQILELNPEHRPHDPRKQFITMAKKYKMDQFAIKRIVGHALDDITEEIYTERPISWYMEEMQKIK